MEAGTSGALCKSRDTGLEWLRGQGCTVGRKQAEECKQIRLHGRKMADGNLELLTASVFLMLQEPEKGWSLEVQRL